MALGVSVGLFLCIFGFGLWPGEPSAAGWLAQFFWFNVVSTWCFPVEVAHFLLTTELPKVEIVVGLVQFVFSVGPRILPLG